MKLLPRFLALILVGAGPAFAQAEKPANPPAPAKPAAGRADARPAAPKATAVAKPAPASYQDGIPVGLFFMTRYWFATRSLEKAAWYFAPDHTVYRQLETGFSAADLAAHRGGKGTAQLAGDKLVVVWSDGRKTSSTLERDTARSVGFAWDGGLFSAVEPIESAAKIAGNYEGGESISFAGGSSAVAKGLTLNPDGTFRRGSVAAISTSTEASRVTAGGSGGSTGTWRVESYSLILTDEAGNVVRGIAFPYDDEKTPITPDRLFFAGTMFKKSP